MTLQNLVHKLMNNGRRNKYIRLSKYDKYIIQNDEQQSDVVITPPTTKFDSSKYDKYLTTDESTQQIESPKTETTFTISEQEEPSWFRKFTYGFDKQDQFFGCF